MDVVGETRAAWKKRRPVGLLLGAGCSFSAGVPLASEVVEYLLANQWWQKGKKGTDWKLPPPDANYGTMMKCLEVRNRAKLFRRMVEHATLNRAHLALGQLVRADRFIHVLTTNFDDLVVRGCSWHGTHPVVHDLGILKRMEETEAVQYLNHAFDLRLPSVFHLHGRHNAAYQLHSDEQVEAQVARLAPVFRKRAKLWIVVGYSGTNDPLWSLLRTEAKRPGVTFYWVNIAEPEPDVLHDLRRAKAKFVPVDADKFFNRFATALGGSPRRWQARREREGEKLIRRPSDPGRGLLVEKARLQVRAAWAQLDGSRGDAVRTRGALRSAFRAWLDLNPLAPIVKLHDIVREGDSVVDAADRRRFKNIVDNLRHRRSAHRLWLVASCACAAAAIQSIEDAAGQSTQKNLSPTQVAKLKQLAKRLEQTTKVRPLHHLANACVAAVLSHQSKDGSRPIKHWLSRCLRAMKKLFHQLAQEPMEFKRTRKAPKESAKEFFDQANAARDPSAQQRLAMAALEHARKAIPWPKA